jgi:hypothetical protein
MLKKTITAFCFLFIFCFVQAQDSTLLALLEDTTGNKTPVFVTSTFKATQIVNTPTIESLQKKTCSL